MHLAEGSVVEYGASRALWELIKRLDLIEVINHAATKSKGMPVGELVAIMAMNRCLDPKSKWEIPHWYERTCLPELTGIELPEQSGYQTLTRCLDFLTDDVQRAIELALARNTIKQFKLDPKMFIYDLTSTFVEGEGAAPILQYGYSRDHRPDCKQVNYALCVTMPEGVPLFHEAFPGNLVDSKTVKTTMERFRDQLELTGCLVVDRGIVTHGNVEEIVDVNEFDLVGGVRLDVGLKPRIARISLDRYGPAFTRGKETLRAFELSLDIRGKKRRGILYFSAEKAVRDKAARERALAQVAGQLDAVVASLAREGRGRKPEAHSTARKIDRLLEDRHCEKLVKWKFTGGRGGRRLKWWVEEKAVRRAERLDGKYVLITTLDLSALEILELYRARDKVERAFRITKDVIKIRPIWNHKESHIKAHLFVCYLAYLLMSLVQIVARRTDPKLSALKALEKMATITKRVDRVIRPREGARDVLSGFTSPDS